MLRYVPAAELERIRTLDADPYERAAAFADACRLNALYMIERAGSGHPGTTFSCLDIVSWLHLEVLGDGDRYFSSKGHDAPGLYAVLTALGRLDFELIHQLRRLDGLPGHPDVAATPEVVTSTGSLGMGISKARGFVLADRALGRCGQRLRPHRRRRAPGGPVLGVAPADREPRPARDHRDRRPQQGPVGHLGRRRSATSATSRRSSRRSAGRSRAATATTCACSRETLERLRAEERPKLVIADTRKGGGVSFMEPHEPAARPTPRSTATTPARRAPTSTSARSRRSGAARTSGSRGSAPARSSWSRREPPEHRSAPKDAAAARRRPTARRSSSRPSASRGSSPSTPTCGSTPASSPSASASPTASSSAGSPSRTWSRRPARWRSPGCCRSCHSFACFLSTRPNEQIYNNATEGTKVIYVGSLAGLVPGGPGHSHQSVRDISALGAVPGHGADRAVLARPRSQAARRLGGAPRARARSTCASSACRGRSASTRRRSTSSCPGRGTVLRAGGRRALRRRRAGDGRGRLARGRAARRGRGRGGRRRAALAARRRRRLARRGRRRRADRHASTTTTSPAARATRCWRRSPPRRPRRPRACTRSASPRCRRAAATTRSCAPTASTPAGSAGRSWNGGR